MYTARDEQRRLIENLMGKDIGYRNNPTHRTRFQHKSNRYNNSFGHISSKEFNLYDPKICKSYLVGDCPYDLFQGTKQNMGKCPQLHITKFKLQYERDLKKGKKYPAFENEYMLILSRFINDCNAQVVQATKKLEHTPEERAKIHEITKELDVLDTRIGLMLQEIDALITHDQITKSILQSIKLDELRARRTIAAKKIKNITENFGQSAQQKLQVCEVCGAYLSRLDTDRRLADHFLGKIHLGYVKMRESYCEYLEKRKKDSN